MANKHDNLYVPGLFSNAPGTLSIPLNGPGSSATSSRVDLHMNRDRSAADTLRFVLANSYSLLGSSHHDRRLIESFQVSSTSDKAFVASVAKCSKDLQEWCEELEGWSWNGNFEDGSTSQDETSVGGGIGHTKPYDDTDMSGKAAAAMVQYTGSFGGLSAQQLSVYQERLKEIRAELGKIDMDEMKARALTTHLRQDIMVSEGASTEVHAQSPHARLDVLSALVTVALLEALPHYSRVISLTETWVARIAVLELVPGFSISVEDAKAALDSAWQCIEGEALSLSDAKFEQLQNDLEEKVANLGQTIDFMLDTLEGLEDTLPEKWVDIVEALEVDYSAWTVAARKILLKHLNEHGAIQDVPPSHLSLLPEAKSFEGHNHAESRRMDTSPILRSAADRDDTGIGGLSDKGDNFEYRDPQVSERDFSSQPDIPTFRVQPSADLAESSPSNHTYQQSLAHVQAGLNYQNSSARDFGLVHAAAHSRGPSIESVDSVIANPDGSHKFPILRRQSMYRTASTASFGPISSSQIRSVDLGRNPNRAAFLRRDSLPAQIQLSNIASDPIQSFQELGGSPNFESPIAAKNNANNNQIHQSLSSSSKVAGEMGPATSSATNDRGIAFQNGVGESLKNKVVDETVDRETYLVYGPPISTEYDRKFAKTSPELDIFKARNDSSAPDEEPTGSLKNASAATPDRPAQISVVPISTDEQLDSRIDRILTSIPTRINFSRRTAGSSGFRTATPSSERATTPSLTLAPAEQRETRAARSNGDSAIKVYYLYQEGRQNPIKLYVRLVGESGERVMVRVGGGWADLGEYLREYASHHSRTVVPEPNAPLQAVDLQQPSNTRVFSLPLMNNDSSSASPTPPESPTSGKRWSGPGKPRTAGVPGDTLQVPLRRSPRVKSVKKTRSLQDMSSPPQDQDQDQGDGLTESPLPSEASAPGKLTDEKKKWLEEMVTKAKRWKAGAGGATTSPPEPSNAASAHGFSGYGQRGLY